MASAVVLPKLGNTVETCIIVRWHKSIGETITAGDVLCEVETDKATLEVESTTGGTVLDLFFAEGDEVPVMTNIAAIGEAGETMDHLRPVDAEDTSPPPEPEETSPQSPSEIQAQPDHDRLKISPRAKNLATKKAVDPAQVTGSGPGGRIIERDIEAAIAAQPQLTPVAQRMVAGGEFQAPDQGSGPNNRVTSRDLLSATPVTVTAAELPDDEIEIIKLTGPRRIIAKRMLQSLQTTAQLTLNASADARALRAYRLRLKESSTELGLQQITINDLILFAVSRTLLSFPEVNALFEEQTITRHKHVHLAFAVDTPRGLMVPVIRYANRLSLKQIAAEARQLANACLEGGITPDDLQGGTFTVTNLGNLGIESFTPVLNPPQVGILGVGNINLKPIEVDGQVEHIPHIGLSLTINHQVVDGAPGARFLQTLSANLADLELLLAL